jgi:hypothetical protein
MNEPLRGNHRGTPLAPRRECAARASAMYETGDFLSVVSVGCQAQVPGLPELDTKCESI